MRSNKKAALRPLCLAILFWGASGISLADDEPVTPAARLKDRGLNLEGGRFVHESELPALRAAEAAEQAVAEAGLAVQGVGAVQAGTANHVAMIRRVAGLENQEKQLLLQVNQLPRRLRRNPQVPVVGQLYQTRSELARLRNELANSKLNLPKASTKKAMVNELGRSRSIATERVDELVGLIEQVAEMYRELNADDSLKGALAEFNRANKTSFQIQPSERLVKVRRWAMTMKGQLDPTITEPDEPTAEDSPSEANPVP